MTWVQARILIALAENDLNVQKTARSLRYHRNSVEYHLRRIKQEQGLDPKRFHDLCALLPEAKDIMGGNKTDGT